MPQLCDGVFLADGEIVLGLYSTASKLIIRT